VNIAGEARIRGRQAIDRVERDRHHHSEPEQKRAAEFEDSLGEKLFGSAAFEAWPGEHARQEEPQRHQVGVLPGAEDVKA
jgi:hypothetical protein